MKTKLLVVPHPLLGAFLGGGLGGVIGAYIAYMRSVNGPRPRNTGGFTEPLDGLFGVLGDGISAIIGFVQGGTVGLTLGALVCWGIRRYMARH